MDRLVEFWRRVRYLFHRGQWENDLQEEMRLHMELRAADQAAQGTSERDAELHAKKRFGNPSRLREDSRAVWGWAFWDTLAQDVRYGLRTLAANPGFTAAAVLSLALGIGANTAIFNILNAVMLRTLPVEDPGRLVQLRSDGGVYTNPIWEQVRDQQKAFSGVLAYSSDRFDLANGGESRFARGIWVSGDFFRVLGVPAIRGRVFSNDDDVHGGGRSGPVAVISYSFWQTTFASDPDVLGKTVSLNRHAFQIIGVTPPWFRGLDVDVQYDVAIPIGCEPLLHTDQSALNHRSWWWLRILGRLPPDETIPQAEARLNAAASDIARATVPPKWKAEMQKRFLARKFALTPAATGFSDTGRQYKTALFTLMTVVGLVLLIACANIANLLLARSSARQREISIRLAIGAARSRVVRQLLTESLLLSVAGAAGGLVFAVWGSKLLVGLLSTTSNQLQIDVSPDLYTFAFTGSIAVLTGILFGFLPALRATSMRPNQVLKESARGAVAGSSRFNLGKALVIGQVALSLTLLVGAGLFLSTLRNLLTIDAGFNRTNVLLVQAEVPAASLEKPLRTALFEKILTSLSALHGVHSVAASRMTPVGRIFWNYDTQPEGYQPKPVEDDTLVYFNRISPGYFHALETPILMGRDFSERDTLTSPPVVIIGELTARHFWGNANPIGKMISTDNNNKLNPYQVIGVVKNAKYGALDEAPLKTAYLALSQDNEPEPGINYELRFDGPVEALTSGVRSAIASINKDASLEFRTLETQVSDSLMQPRLVALLSSFFGALALLLAIIGLYGVISYATARRRSEIGIRVALGAEQRTVIWLVLRDVVIVLAAGTILGAAASIAANRWIATLLFGVRPTDPVTIVMAALVLAVAGAVAGYVPARRAATMDPMAALRDE